MSRITDIFRDKKKKALIAYVTVGYPTVDATLEIVPQLAKNGCDIIELGIPFSDPLADGVTIQNSSYHALQNGVTTHICLEIAGKLRRTVDIPLIFMTYFNPVFNYGLDKFCSDCSAAGVEGLIVPDLPPDEGKDLEELTKTRDIDLVYLLSPTSTEERIRLVAKKSRGFIYLVSVAGVTGARKSLPADLSRFVARVKSFSKIPVCVGFGISTAAQAAQVGTIADGVIIGSRIIQLMETKNSTQIKHFIVETRRALDRL